MRQRTPNADDRDHYDASPFVPEHAGLPKLSEASRVCRGCPLYKTATQTVFGEGPPSARIMLVGEQPGDQEDIQGKPFVGPAGRILDQALHEAGIPRVDVYVTNAVKHFKWTTSPGGGSRRLHQRPRKGEVAACRPWLEAEIKAVAPEAIVLLGATAAQSLLGDAFRVTQSRGKPIRETRYAPIVMATIHPSAVLRSRGSEDRRGALASLVKDFKSLVEAIEQEAAHPAKRIRML
jgi:uracil-DNA glycosylase family protein